MRGASARPFNPRAFIRDAISAPGRHAPSLAPPPLVKTSCFHRSHYQDLNYQKNKKDKKTRRQEGKNAFRLFMLKGYILEPPAGT
ncbi:MAG: hypothetical protein ACRCV4_16400, partial [Hafnia alvei]